MFVLLIKMKDKEEALGGGGGEEKRNKDSK